MKKKIIITYCLIFSSLATINGYAFSISLGANIARHELIAFTDNNIENVVANFSSSYYASPAIHINSSPNYFGNSRFGWLTEFNFGILNIEQEKTVLNGVSYSPRVRGGFGHVNPIVFYRFGNKKSKGSRSWHLTIGLGYGLSYLELDGEYITTSLVKEKQTLVTINKEQGYFWLPATVVDFNWNHWYAKMSICFGGSGFEIEKYTYNVLFRSIGVGYDFEF